MRYMLLMKGEPPQDGSWTPEFMGPAVAAMRAYDEDMRRAGVLVAAEGLVPAFASKGIVFNGRGNPRVIDGPFTEAKEVVAGFCIIDVASEEEAIEWAKRCPVDAFLEPGQEFLGLEVRRIADVPAEGDATAAVLESIQP